MEEDIGLYELGLFLKNQFPFIIVFNIFIYICNFGLPLYIAIIYIQILYSYLLLCAIKYEKNRYITNR
jgi:hypothetical protein